jgi:hypothetical protein
MKATEGRRHESAACHRWSTIALAAVAAFIIALLVLSGTAQVVVALAAVLVFLFAVLRALDSESYRKRDADIPFRPGSHGPPGGIGGGMGGIG